MRGQPSGCPLRSSKKGPQTLFRRKERFGPPPLATLPGGGGRGNPFCERPSASPQAQSSQGCARIACLPWLLRLTPPPASFHHRRRQAPSPRMSLTRITVGGFPPPTPPLTRQGDLLDHLIHNVFHVMTMRPTSACESHGLQRLVQGGETSQCLAVQFR